MSLTKTAIKGGLWNAGIRYVAFAINFIGNLWLARLLFPEDFGTFALAMSMSEIIFMIGGFGLAQACIQLQNEPDVFDTAMFLGWGFTFVLSTFGVVIAWLLRGMYTQEVILMMAVLCIMKSFQIPKTIYLAYFDKNLSFRRSAIITSFSASSALAISIILAYVGFGVWSLLLKEALNICFGFVCAILFSPYHFRFSFNKATASKIWRFSFGMFFMQMSEVLYSRGPNFLIGTLAGPLTLGFFERSLYLAGLPNTLLSQFHGNVGFAVFSRVKGKSSKITEGLNWILFFTSRIIFFPCVMVFLYPEFIITILLGHRWVSAAPFLQGLSFFISIHSLTTCIKPALLAIGSFKPIIFGMVATILIVIQSIVIAHFWNGYWQMVTWGLGIGTFFRMIIFYFACKSKQINLQLFESMSYPVLIAIAICLVDIFLKDFNAYAAITLYGTIWFITLAVLDRNRFKMFLNLVKK